MKALFTLLVLVFISVISYSQSWQWTHVEPNGALDAPYEDDYGSKVITDANGNLYELGVYKNDLYLAGKLKISGSGSNIPGSFIAKYNASGKLLWYKTINRISSESGAAIAGGDIVISNNKLFLTGNYRTSNFDQYPCQSGTPIHFTYNICNNILTTSSSDMGMFFSCLDLNGDVQWIKTAKANMVYSGSWCYSNGIVPYHQTPHPPLMTTDNNNNIIISFTCSMNNNAGFSLGGDYISTGYTPNPYGSQSIIVVKYDNAGNFIWSNYGIDKQLKGNSPVQKSIACDKAGNIFLHYRLQDSTQFGNIMFRTTSYDAYYQNTGYPHVADGVMIKIAANGTWKFVKEIVSVTSSGTNVNNQNIAVDNNNNVYMATSVVTACDCGLGIILGDTLPTNYSGGYAYLVKLDNAGKLIWKKQFGINQGETLPNGLIFVNNRLYMSGGIRSPGTSSYLFSDLTVPTTTCNTYPNSTGTLQLFVARADTSGTFKWATTVCGGSNMMASSACVYNNNVYTTGNYRISINSLGNLNGSYTNPNGSGYVLNHFLGRLNDQYIKVGAISPLQVCTGSTIKIPFTSFGLNFSANNTFTAELSNAGGGFTNPIAIGSVVATGSGTITGTIPNTIQYGSNYRIRIKSTDTLKTGYFYYVYADIPYALTVTCPAPYTGFAATSIAATDATLNWNTVPCGDFYYVQYRKKGTAAWTTVNNGSNTGSFAISGLSANTVYQWKVATKCTNNGSAVVSAYSKVQHFTTTAALTAMNNRKVINESGTSIQINPNPVRNIATVVYHATLPGTHTLQITDVTGKVLLSNKATAIMGRNTISVDVSRFAHGMYLVSIIDGKAKQTMKFLKE